jgi:hypothetical protein
MTLEQFIAFHEDVRQDGKPISKKLLKDKYRELRSAPCIRCGGKSGGLGYFRAGPEQSAQMGARGKTRTVWYSICDAHAPTTREAAEEIERLLIPRMSTN